VPFRTPDLRSADPSETTGSSLHSRHSRVRFHTRYLAKGDGRRPREMEFLSHLPSTSPSANPLRPTLFELIAQDQLRDLIQPALRYIVAVLAPLPVDMLTVDIVLRTTTSAVSAEISHLVR
jgi:hypothetical protein